MSGRQIEWWPADGTGPLVLTDPSAGYRALADATTGLTSPAYRIATDQYADIDGVTVRAVAADAGAVSLALLVQAADRTTLRDRMRALVHAMRPKAGPGQLVVADEDGQRRSLTCYYTAGLEGDEARGVKLPGRWWKAVVRLLAEDPWWYGEERSITAALAAGGSFFPFPPLRLAPSTVTGRFTVDLSDTDAETYARWTVLGPGSGLVLANETTGQSTALSATFAGGQSIVIDTRPGEQSVHRGDLEEDDPGWNLFGSLQGDPALWPLVDGVNVITCSLTGATGDSTITGVYAPRYAGI